MADVARAASAMATSGSPPPAALEYHRVVKPSASARCARPTIWSTVVPIPGSPMRISTSSGSLDPAEASDARSGSRPGTGSGAGHGVGRGTRPAQQEPLHQVAAQPGQAGELAGRL